VDETVIKANKKCYYVYANRCKEEWTNSDESLYHKELFDYESFIKEVLKYHENKLKFVVDKAPWLIDALKSLGLEFEHQTFSVKW